MRNVENALEWLKNESKHPSKSWGHLCQSASRSAYGMPAYGGTAREAWLNVKPKYRVDCPDYKDKSWWASVPSGAILYSSGGGAPSAGHAWVVHDAGESAWTVDYKRSGKIDKCQIDLPGWSNIKKHTNGYIFGAQYYDKNDHLFKGLTFKWWDGHTPPHANLLNALGEPDTLANSAAWRLTMRLHDLGFGEQKHAPVRYEQTWPSRNYGKYAAAHDLDPSTYTEATHQAIFGA